MSVVEHEGGRRKTVALAVNEWLAFAAAPVFAAMAILSGIAGQDGGMMCASLSNASALSGMVPMYILMCIFHLAPWLKLISRRRILQ